MKIFLFLISLIILFTKGFTQKENKEEVKKKKDKYIIEHFFKNKIKKKSNINWIKGESDDVSYNFNFWERMQYKNIENKENKNKEKPMYINLSRDTNTHYDNYNNEYIHDITKELNVLNGDYKINNLLTKFNNRKFIEEVPFPNLSKDNLPNSNQDNNNDKYNEFLQRNKMYKNNINNNNYNNEYINNNNDYSQMDNINTINNLNYINQINQMNNRHHHNSRGFSQGVVNQHILILKVLIIQVSKIKITNLIVQTRSQKWEDILPTFIK